MEMNDIQPSDFKPFKKCAAFHSDKKGCPSELERVLMPQLELFSKELMISQPIRVKEKVLALNRKNQVKATLGQISPEKPGYDADILKSESSALIIKFSNCSILSLCQAFRKKISGQCSSKYNLAGFFQRIFKGANRIDETNSELLSFGNTCVNLQFENTLSEFLYLKKVFTTGKLTKPLYNSKQKLACCSI